MKSLLIIMTSLFLIASCKSRQQSSELLQEGKIESSDQQASAFGLPDEVTKKLSKDRLQSLQEIERRYKKTSESVKIFDRKDHQISYERFFQQRGQVNITGFKFPKQPGLMFRSNRTLYSPSSGSIEFGTIISVYRGNSNDAIYIHKLRADNKPKLKVAFDIADFSSELASTLTNDRRKFMALEDELRDIAEFIYLVELTSASDYLNRMLKYKTSPSKKAIEEFFHKAIIAVSPSHGST